MTDEARKKVEQSLHYKLLQWKKTITFGILNNISEYVTLMQLMNLFVNVNHAVSVVREWIFYSNYDISLLLNIDSLNLVYACYDGED